MSKHYPKDSKWNDEPIYERSPRDIEEVVEIRATSKRLADCDLPAGFVLLTPRPRQFVLDNQLVWAFCIAWARVDRHGKRGPDEFFHVERYDPRIKDEIQMEWALTDFTNELSLAQLKVA